MDTIISKNNKNGQMSIIPGSHLWGHIPHSNRKPLKLPEKYKSISTDLEIGDIIIFATMLLHKTEIAESPRLALPVLVKNFKYLNNSFEKYRNWKIFFYLEIIKIERILGNHHLSPFRINSNDSWWLNEN